MNNVINHLADNVGKYTKILGSAIIGLSIFNGSYTIIPEGNRGIRVSFGEATGMTSQGWQWKIPIFQQIKPVSVMADAVEIKNAEGATRDTQPVHTNLVVRYHINENEALRIYKDISKDGDLDNIVFTSTLEAFKAVTSKYSADELISRRPEVSTAMSVAIQNKLHNYGATLLSVDVTGFSFSKSYMDAINSKVTEKELREAEVNKLERIKVEQQQSVVKANAEAEAAIATAKGKAEATRLEAAALRENNSILEVRRIEVAKIQAERWDGKLPSTVMGNAVPMINIGNK